MTVQETILSFPGLADFPAGFLPVILDSRSMDAAAEREDYNPKQIDLAIADTLAYAVNLPDFSEGKLSMTYSRESFVRTARFLYRQNGEPERANALATKVPRGRANDIW